eukprot:scaffold215307_cov27-Prasinocladus_malaysianus.AAC.1
MATPGDNAAKAELTVGRQAAERSGDGDKVEEAEDVDEDEAGYAGTAVAPQVVGSPVSKHQYHLQSLLALVPTHSTRTSVVRHVHWDGERLPLGAPRHQGGRIFVSTIMMLTWPQELRR